MLTYTVDHAVGNSICDTCCCEPMLLRRGDTSLVTINYAPWSVTIGGPGIMPTLESAMELIADSCPTNEIDGHVPPSNTNYELTTAVNTALNFDLGSNVGPSGNTFLYRAPLMLSGPRKGVLSLQPGETAGSALYTYTPNNGFEGYDSFSYTTVDAQGREVIRHVSIKVGALNAFQDPTVMSLTPYVDQSKIVTDQRSQMVRFPIYMPTSVLDCEVHRLTIKQPAQDCDRNTFTHTSCYDIRVKDC